MTALARRPLAAAPTAVLVVDDDPAMREMIAAHLARRGCTVVTRAGAADALAAIDADADAHAFDVVVADIHMRDLDGVALCGRIRARRPRLPVILITGFGTMDTAILAIRAGAFDFLPKPFRIDDLVDAVERAAAIDRTPRLAAVGDAPAPTHAHGELIGDAPAMHALRALITKLAASSAPVLITGESGTGKELVARALHAAGPRATGPLIAINCAAMPAALLESELFGHARGAFTDAGAAKQGLFEAANGGTLFLDEIGELPLELQPKLLRALQQRAIRPVGATREVPFDARLVTATHRDLSRMVADQQFRADLFFRIHVVQVAVPPLRARRDDVERLARHFLQRAAAAAGQPVRALAPDAAAALAAYAWPGNVRELENCIEHAIALADDDGITVDDLPHAVRTHAPRPRAPIDEDVPRETLAQLERRHIARVLADVGGNKTAAARILGIERRTLYRMLERWRG